MTREPAKTLAHDERGTILVLWAIVLGVVLGFVALSFDLGRASITRSELQSFADSVALASAGELDGTPDSITRARTAAALILDQQSFGNTDRSLQGAVDYTLTFFRSLPASDASAMTDVTTDPARAAFVRVSVTPTVVESTFGAAFASLTNLTNRDYTLGATAVAGLSILACDVQPMMFCLPNANYTAEGNIGDMIRLRAGGSGAAWAPGDFGFLDPRGIEVDPSGPCAGENGAGLLRCLIGAVDNITQCFDQRGVDIEPGQKNGLENSIFNVRFDIYNQAMGNARYQNSPNYAPAPNVIKGLVPPGRSTCVANNPAVSPNTVALPKDTCFLNGTCATASGTGNARFGDGVWSRSSYFTPNYGVPNRFPSDTTRYQVYLRELATAGTGNILTGRAETGRPTCSGAAPAGPDRRIITVAGIDCAANNIRGAANNVPVKEFFKIFLTEPVDSGNNIWGEVVGSASEEGTGAIGTGGIVRDVVQLYR
ncbi:pilus assembly protein TadG-related protein [Tabrizicola sp. BL-A-41-H6]|uniref:pilus assembly protein TadG-related protein n=1 Tax=Tabrizicola sp. BL-A-41-H6 TaxID=3421107 RepID=UPI003D66C039